MDYHLRINSLPEDVIFKAYLQRAIDHLSLVYDPAYSSQEIYDASTGTTVMQWLYPSWHLIPDIFRDGQNILEYAKGLEPVIGTRKNADYLPFLVDFSVYSLSSYGTLTGVVLPEDGETVTPLNMGTTAEKRFPTIHGASGIGEITRVGATGGDRWWYYPLNLDGDICRTAAKSQMAYIFDRALDRNVAILHQNMPFYKVEEPEFWKKTDMYCTFHVKQYENGEMVRQDSSTNYGHGSQGRIGWLWDSWGGRGKVSEKAEFTVNITSKSPFRYKFIVLAEIEGDSEDRQRCPYDFSPERISVIYESPDWITGNTSWTYEFGHGEDPGTEDKFWEITLYEQHVIIFPEFPDRLKELTGI